MGNGVEPGLTKAVVENWPVSNEESPVFRRFPARFGEGSDFRARLAEFLTIKGA